MGVPIKSLVGINYEVSIFTDAFRTKLLERQILVLGGRGYKSDPLLATWLGNVLGYFNLALNQYATPVDQQWSYNGVTYYLRIKRLSYTYVDKSSSI